jgi:hypothetical protein
MKKAFYIIFLLLLIVSLISCDVQKRQETIQEVDYIGLVEYFHNNNLDFQRIELEPDCLFPILSKADVVEEYEKISDLLLNNSTYLSSQLEPVKYEGNNIPWGSLESSYNLNINSFKDVQCLIFLYEHTNDIKYLQEAKRLILSWIEYEASPESSKNIYVWCDQSVANRTQVLIHFLLYEDVDTAIYDTNTVDLIKSYIERQGEWLFDDANYSLGNHGIMMDRALLELSFYVKETEAAKKYFNRAIERLETAIHRDFTSDGVHLENSPGYHRLVMDWYIEVRNFLKHYINIPNNTILEIVTTRASDYLVRIILPNDYLPRIGDTSNTEPLTYGYKNEYFNYIVSSGVEGTMPDGGLVYYDDAGILLYRNDFKAENVDRATWWCLKSGAKSSVHKHDDDLSLMIYSHGKEILTDGGQYNYISGDAFRQYVLSPEAHNSLSIKGKAYYGNVNYDKVGFLEKVEETKEYSWYRGVNRAYGHTHIQRNLIFFEPNIFIIVDDGWTMGEQQEYTQHFLLGPNMQLKEFDNSGFYAVSDDGKAWIKATQYINVENTKLFRADEETGYGYISETFNNKTPINYVTFENTSKKVRYVTSLVINGENNADLDIKVNNSVIKLYLNSKEYSFNIEELNYEEIGKGMESSLVVKSERMLKQDSTYRFEIETFNPNVLYAFYLYKDDVRIDLQNYSSINYYEFAPLEAGEYVVKYFVVNADTEDLYGTIAPDQKRMGVFKDKIIVNEKDIEANLSTSLQLKSENLTKQGDKYLYELKTYNPNVLYAFYLFKDGERIDFKAFSEENYYSFKPNEKGEYRIKWFLIRDNVKDKYSEPLGPNKQSGEYSESIIID